MSEITKKEWVQTPLDDNKLAIFGTPWNPTDFKKAPILKPSIWKNNPRFQITMRNPAEDGKVNSDGKELWKQPVIVALNRTYMRIILQDIISISLGKDIPRRVIRNKGNIYQNGVVISDKPVVVSTLAYGRDDTGAIYIQVKAHDREAATFIFKPDYWHEIEDTGNVDGGITEREVADSVAREWARDLIEAYGKMHHDHFEPYDKNRKTAKAATAKAAEPVAVGDW